RIAGMATLIGRLGSNAIPSMAETSPRATVPVQSLQARGASSPDVVTITLTCWQARLVTGRTAPIQVRAMAKMQGPPAAMTPSVATATSTRLQGTHAHECA